MVLGRYLIVGYLDPQGDGFCLWPVSEDLIHGLSLGALDTRPRMIHCKATLRTRCPFKGS